MPSFLAKTRRVSLLTLALALVATAGLIAVAGSRAAASTAKPTIVLVHGAWANSASWTAVIGRLQSEGYTVDAPPNPLRSLDGDAASIADYVKSIQGPVVLVGHSYGGAVITNAAHGLSNVKALVYVDAFIPAKGETVLGLDGKYPGSVLGSAPADQVFDPVAAPGLPKSDPLLYVQPSVFLKGFANDLPAAEGRELAATQAPVAEAALATPSGTPAWATIPSWDVVGTIDHAIPLKTQLFMAHRARARITEVRAGHLSMISQPATVAKVITEAAQSVS